MTSKIEEAEDAAIADRAARITAKVIQVDAMRNSDPLKVYAQLILNNMRYDQSAALMTRSMARGGPDFLAQAPTAGSRHAPLAGE